MKNNKKRKPKPVRIPPQTQYEKIYWVLCFSKTTDKGKIKIGDRYK